MRRFLVNRWFHTFLLLALLGGALTVQFRDFSWIKSLRFIAFDNYNRLYPREATGQTVVVDIDEASLAHPELGQWPWSRDALMHLVDNLSAMGAKAIVFDIVFAERDRTSPQAIMERLPKEYRNKEAAKLLLNMPDNDDLFAQGIKRSDRVVTGFIYGDRSTMKESPVLSQPILMTKAARPLVGTVRNMPGIAVTLPELSRAAAGNGSFGAVPEIDGVIRQVPLLFSFNQLEAPHNLVAYPSLALEALRVSQGAKTLVKIKTLTQQEAGNLMPSLRLTVGNYEVPLDWDGLFNVYFAPWQPKNYIPAWKVVDGSVDPALVKNKIVFIGTSAEGLKDLRSSPLNLTIPGVELHTNIVEQVLSGKFLLRSKPIQGMEALATGGIGFFIILFAPFAGAVLMAFFTLSLIAAICFSSWYSYVQYGILLDPVFPSLCIFLLFVLSSLLTYIRTEAERYRVRTAFGFYISPDFMDELTKNPDKLKLGGETRDLTVMFTDIRNFTTISESLKPEELIQLMNDFLTPMSDLVMGNRGTIDKYMGDAMMAFWNAPLDDEEHARNACLTALKMNETLAPLNEAIRAKAAPGKAPVLLQAGIGINSGNASVGNMGSRQRFAYSALGDTVNLASRLESQTKTYGVNILIGESTRSKAPALASLEVDLLKVKGKMEPVRVHALLGDEAKAQSAAFKGWQDAHNAMLSQYRAAKFKEAMGLIEECRKQSGGDMAVYYAMLAARIAELQEKGVPPGWDGTFAAASK